jgi:hypothetical protein
MATWTRFLVSLRYLHMSVCRAEGPEGDFYITFGGLVIRRLPTLGPSHMQ